MLLWRGILVAGFGLSAAAGAQTAVRPIDGAVTAPNDTVKIGPVPAWVEPIAIPVDATEATRGQALGFRLLDDQIRLDDQGLHEYHHIVMRVTRAEALTPAGAIALPWQPGTSSLTVVALHIVRDGQTIDVLKDQQFSLIRRENGFETGQLDGVLTATMQIQGLQVGDTIDIETLLDQLNPVLSGKDEALASLFGALTADRLHYSISWPSARGTVYRAGTALPKTVVTTKHGITKIELDQSAFHAPQLPASVPTRFLERGQLAATDFKDWSGVAAVFAPLFAKAATLAADSPLKAEIAAIAGASDDPKARAEAALHLVESKVRYVFDARGLGGYAPADADTVWQHRYGDCKGKTVLLLALLHGLGIEARPALVSSQYGDGLEDALPMPQRFDHVLVEANIAGKTYWLDGTRIGDTTLDRLEIPDFHWALPLVDGGATLVGLKPTPSSEPNSEFAVNFDASKGVGVPAPAHGSLIFHGDGALSVNASVVTLSEADRETQLRALWKQRLDFVTIDTVDYLFDEKAGTATLSFTGTGNLDWSLTGSDAQRRYTADYARVGMTIAPDRKDGSLKSLPVLVTPDYNVVRETIVLPHDGKGFTVDGDQIDQTIAGVHYVRTAKIAGGSFNMEAITRSPRAEISLDDAEAADKKSTDLFGKTLTIDMPTDYAFNAAELAAIKKSDKDASKTADAKPDDGVGDAVQVAIDAANRQIRDHDRARALATLDGAIAKDDSNARLYAARGSLHLMREETDKADADIDAALAIDPQNREAIKNRIFRLEQQARYDDAAILLDRLILLDPGSPDAYLQRASLRANTGKIDPALADLAIVARMAPDNVNALTMRVGILGGERRFDEALSAADAYVDAHPGNARVEALRGGVLAQMKRPDEARAAFAKSIAIEPTANAYATILNYQLAKNPADALADALAILRLEPGGVLARAQAAEVVSDPENYQKLRDAYQDALKAHPENREELLQSLAEIDTSADRNDRALASFDMLVEEHPGNPSYLNNRCWFRATKNVDLDKARRDCDAAIAGSDNPGTRDSLAFVEYRQGKFEAAIADYDKALAKAPNLVDSLYGRGLAKLAMDRQSDGLADIAKARARSDRIDEAFADYGVTIPPKTAVAGSTIEPATTASK